jgi:hypothetical protein
MTLDLEALFPRLRGSGYQVTSPADGAYNCVAWAAGDTRAWWWPDADGMAYWPAGAPREETVAAIREAFATLGFVECAEGMVEAGWEQVAVFADPWGFPTHLTRQLPNGRWTSKLGELVDIEHALDDLSGQEYGAVVLRMKRPRPTALPTE